MLLQPFFENAIYHGMKGAGNKGRIEIHIEKGEQNLHCTILDNGRGLQRETTVNRKSLAVRITRERLDIVSKETGKPASVAIYNKTGNDTGVVVELFIPYLE
jgi:sensor histidine kinase YesM